MSNDDKKFRGIPIVEGEQVKSGQKYRTEAGFSAVKNGVKQRRDNEPLVRGDRFTWAGWDEVQWHERRKAGWPLLQASFRGYLGPLAPRDGP